jgi:tetratricopeptide (TPR) repeat protein
LYLLAGDLEQALEACELSKQMKRTPNDLLFIEGRIQRKLGNEEQAVHCFQICLENSRSETSALAKVCNAFLGSKNLD